MATERETLSDHEYVTFSVAAMPGGTMVRRREMESQSKRWAFRKLDGDAFMAHIQGALMTREGAENLEEKLRWILETMETACDASMPRSKFRPPKKAYWWTEQIAELRKEVARAKRKARSLRHKDGEEEVWAVYRSLRDQLRLEIRRAKAGSWNELLSPGPWTRTRGDAPTEWSWENSSRWRPQ